MKAAVNGSKEIESVEIHLPKLEIQEVDFTIIGESALIMNKWSEKAKKMILDKQTKKATKGREKKDPKKDYEASIYRDGDGNVVFPH